MCDFNAAAAASFFAGASLVVFVALMGWVAWRLRAHRKLVEAVAAGRAKMVVNSGKTPDGRAILFDANTGKSYVIADTTTQPQYDTVDRSYRPPTWLIGVSAMLSALFVSLEVACIERCIAWAPTWVVVGYLTILLALWAQYAFRLLWRVWRENREELENCKADARANEDEAALKRLEAVDSTWTSRTWLVALTSGLVSFLVPVQANLASDVEWHRQLVVLLDVIVLGGLLAAWIWHAVSLHLRIRRAIRGGR